ncbi:MAG: hypothetical protein JF596_21765, partial [Stenotrophomonas sp.]|nr:hypothetical protein [Stenotrophomonas sp.]
RTTLATPNSPALNRVTGTNGFLTFVDNLFAETGSTTGVAAGLQSKLALHSPGPLHAGDSQPVRIYATGDISGFTLFSSKVADVVAGEDLTDVALYIQNVNSSDISVVSAGRDIIAYNANSALRTLANSTGNTGDAPRAGDIQISGPGTLEVLAGRNLDLGTGAENEDGTGSGITSIGNARNPALSFEGANVIVGAGLGTAAVGLANSDLDFDKFLRQYVGTGASASGVNYLSELQSVLGDGVQLNSAAIDNLSEEQKSALALEVFYLVLRDSGRAHNDPSSPSFGSYADDQYLCAFG